MRRDWSSYVAEVPLCDGCTLDGTVWVALAMYDHEAFSHELLGAARTRKDAIALCERFDAGDDTEDDTDAR